VTFEKTIRMTAKMLEVRDTMRFFWGDKYRERIEPFRDAIRRWTAETGKPKGEVALHVCKVSEKNGDPMDVALAIAAFCEDVEIVEKIRKYILKRCMRERTKEEDTRNA